MTHSSFRSIGQTGFTLVELMITLVIAAILLAIAVPSYNSQIRKSRRTEARTALLDLATREERNLSTNNAYTNSSALLGYGPTGWPMAVGSGYYNVTVTAPLGANPPTYQIQAVPVGPQAQDTSCVSFTVDQLGNRTSADSNGADSTATCWR